MGDRRLYSYEKVMYGTLRDMRRVFNYEISCFRPKALIALEAAACLRSDVSPKLHAAYP